MYEDLSYTYGSGTYAIYLRKSRKDLDAEAMGEGETLSAILDILKTLAKRMKLNVVKVYAEVVSGESIDARPQMQELLGDVETGIYDGVLVVEVERLARGDTSDQGRVAKTFKFSNTLIITPSKTYDPNNEFDEEYFEFGLFMSRREYQDHPPSSGCRIRCLPPGREVHRQCPTLRICPEEAEEGKGLDPGE